MGTGVPITPDSCAIKEGGACQPPQPAASAGRGHGPPARNVHTQGVGDEGTTPSDTIIDYNKVSSFQINLSSRFENKLLPYDLIIVRNHGDDEEDIGEEFGGVVDQQEQPSRVGCPIQVEFESASESRSSPH